jgi:hypothetical protein
MEFEEDMGAAELLVEMKRIGRLAAKSVGSARRSM